jgi:hypothetical protein
MINCFFFIYVLSQVVILRLITNCPVQECCWNLVKKTISESNGSIAFVQNVLSFRCSLDGVDVVGTLFSHLTFERGHVTDAAPRRS